MKKLIPILVLIAAAAFAATYDTPGIVGGGGGDTVNAPVAFGSIPACSTSEFFQPLNDSIYDYAYCDGASTLSYYVGGFEATPPPSTGWTWVNQGSATIATTGGTQVLVAPSSASNSIRARVRTIPSAPYTVTMGFAVTWDQANFADAGLLLRNNSGGTISLYAISSTVPNGAFANKWTSATAFSASYTLGREAVLPNGQLVLLRLADNSTNRVYSISHDMGLTWSELFSVARTDFHTPDEIGFYGNTSNSDEVTVTVWHWLEE